MLIYGIFIRFIPLQNAAYTRNNILSFDVMRPFAYSWVMRSERLCITLPPRLCRRVKKEADRRQISVSKCIADYIEKNTDDDLVYSKEELDRRIKEGDAEYARGETKSFRSVDEMFKALNEECDLHEAVL